MRSQSSNSDSNCNANSSTNSGNDDENINNDHDQRIGTYCTLRKSRKSNEKQQDSMKNQVDVKNYCTVGRRLKNLIRSDPLDCNLLYKKLNDFPGHNESSKSSVNFGISNDLSTESMKNACEYFELTDDDDEIALTERKHVEAVNNSLLNKIENQFSNFKRSSQARFSARSVTLDRKKKHDHFHPYCTMRRDKISNNEDNSELRINEHQNSNRWLSTVNRIHPYYKITAEDRGGGGHDNDCNSIRFNHDSIEAFNILSELDAILDNHEISSPTHSLSPVESEPEKIEDCLLELDAYLEEIDSISINSNSNYSHYKNQIINPNKMLGQEFQRSRTLPKKLIRTRSKSRNQKFSNAFSENNDRQQIWQFQNAQRLEQKLQYGDIIGDDGNLSRGHRFRSTIDVPHQPLSNDLGSEHSNQIMKERQKSWRRHSMRKTSLLVLPDHQEKDHRFKALPTQTSIHLKRLRLENSCSNEILNGQPIVSPRLINNNQNYSGIAYNNSSINNNNNISNHIRSNNELSAALCSNSNTTETINCNDLRSLSQVECNYSNNSQNFSHIDIINDILNNSTLSETNQISTVARPRQLGRRAQAQPRVVSIMTETNGSGNQRLIINHERPMSAPATANRRPISELTPLGPSPVSDNNRYIGSEPSSVRSSRNPSPISLLSSTASSSIASAEPEQTITESESQRNQTSDSSDEAQILTTERGTQSNSQWPHGFSRVLALLCCTLGLFNISRFAIITIHYGANFVIQFLILSIVFGIPMLWLQMCLGAKIKSGPISMWKISPICKGIGISLLLTQCITAIYSTISLGWILIYFRDSFISRNDRYRWQETVSLYHGGNNSTDIIDNISDYFNGIVLQRWELSENKKIETAGVRFQLAFNLTIIWTIVFIVLCKGLKSFGKIVLGLTLLPLALLIIVGSKLVYSYLIDLGSFQNWYYGSRSFVTDSSSWSAAAQESFLTWGWLGSSVIAIASKSAEKSEGKTILRRDAFLVVILTFFGLTLAALFGYACIRILHGNGYNYFPAYYEKRSSFSVYSRPGTYVDFISTPKRWSPHYSAIIGDAFMGSRGGGSSYQALRLLTELFPAALSIATQERISPIWALMGYLMFLLFGIAQLCAMWKPISNVLGNAISSVLLSCIIGLLLGIPFATEMGISIIYYFETVIGGSWWILILWTIQILAIFLIRGRPYTGDILVHDLHVYGLLKAFLALSWNVLLPIGLIALSIIEYKLSYANELFNWRRKGYFQLWARKVGCLVQISFLLLVPIIAIIQIYRYLSKGPPDVLDRIQLLYRPSQTPPIHRRNRPNIDRFPLPQVTISLTNSQSPAVQDDAPPKYTPPPSYTTATGARIAKMLRQSIRRSVRRILGERARTRPSIPTGSNQIDLNTMHDSILPPEYSTVLSNPSGEDIQPEIGPRILYNSYTQRTLSLERCRSNESSSSTVPSLSLPHPIITPTEIPAATNVGRKVQTFTAFDVAQILRSSQRHQRSASAIATRVDSAFRSSTLRHHKNSSRSAENLVLNVAPLGESNAITLNSEHPNSDENTSVI